jgi:hypothetical protein
MVRLQPDPGPYHPTGQFGRPYVSKAGQSPRPAEVLAFAYFERRGGKSRLQARVTEISTQ